MKEFWKWFCESNRHKHFGYGAVWGAVFCIIALLMTKEVVPSFWLSVLSTAGVGTALEFKDWQYSKSPDIVDDAMTTLGGIMGAIVPAVIYWIWL